jgi:hypothetical protein
VTALQLSGHGISTDLPDGWEGRITKRVEPGPGARSPVNGADLSVERTHPVVHLANFALPEDRGDFGSGAVELMGDQNLFVCLFEYGPESVGTALFAAQGMPRTIDPARYSSSQLQRTIRGQAGYQTFFTEAGRAFTLFVALGSGRRAAELAPQADAVLATTTIEAR